MDPFSLLSLIPSLIGLFKGGGSSGSTSVTTQTEDPKMAAVMDTQMKRMQLQNPLYEAVTRLAMGLMPTAYQSGNTTLPGVGTGERPPMLPIQPEPKIPSAPGSWGNVGGRTYDPGGAGGAYDDWTPEGLRRRGGRGK
jgi:hypothetical protein